MREYTDDIIYILLNRLELMGFPSVDFVDICL